MYSLIVSKRFKRNLKVFLKKHPVLHDIVEDRLDILQKNPFAADLKTHHLTGKLKGALAISITYEYRLVFLVERNEIWLLAIGTHDEVY